MFFTKHKEHAYDFQGKKIEKMQFQTILHAGKQESGDVQNKTSK